jgi:methionyl-tRNA formyltransferase
LAELGGKAIVNALHQLDSLVALPQPDTGTTYAAKISKAEALLDFSRDASELARAVRAFNPAPGAVTQLNGAILKVWQAHATADSGTAGQLLRANADGLLIACGCGALCLTEIQPAGGKRQTASQFLSGHGPAIGSRFGA